MTENVFSFIAGVGYKIIGPYNINLTRIMRIRYRPMGCYGMTIEYLGGGGGVLGVSFSANYFFIPKTKQFSPF